MAPRRLSWSPPPIPGSWSPSPAHIRCGLSCVGQLAPKRSVTWTTCFYAAPAWVCCCRKALQGSSRLYRVSASKSLAGLPSAGCPSGRATRSCGSAATACHPSTRSRLARTGPASPGGPRRPTLPPPPRPAPDHPGDSAGRSGPAGLLALSPARKMKTLQVFAHKVHQSTQRNTKRSKSFLVHFVCNLGVALCEIP